ncbi:helix-turn-helix domain-containing protein [Streptomyces venezuelae]|uniref:helix-turn-helix domain-containing protein n=1 Tax=Streptomyces venezuelae TaxID=54571 RepID=UPI0037960413
MGVDEGTLAPAARWDIRTPARPGRLPGMSQAGFRDRTSTPLDLPVIPYPAVTLAIDLGNGTIVDTARDRQHGGSVVFGLSPGAVHVRGQNIDCLQIRLSPAVAHAVLGTSLEPGGEGGEIVSLDTLWGREADRLLERLRAAASWDERFAIAEAALARRYEAGRGAVDPEVAHAWRKMVRSRGRVRIEPLAAEVGWSRKRLWARFRSQIGPTPKRAAQLIRFDHAAHRLAAGQSLGSVAAETGYADQSHLHRDVMTFTGTTPTAISAAPWLAVDDTAWAARA